MSKDAKASFHIQFNERERLTFASFEGKGGSLGETIFGQLGKNGEEWETVGKIELYRAPDGTYKQLSDKKRV